MPSPDATGSCRWWSRRCASRAASPSSAAERCAPTAPTRSCRSRPGQAAHRSAALARAWAPFSYEGVARRVVMALKARSATQAARFMAARDRGARARPGCSTRVLVPVPGQPAGNRRRGFDHAHAIARELGPRSPASQVAGALRRAPVRRAGRARPRRAPGQRARLGQRAAAGGAARRPGDPRGRRLHDRRDPRRLRAGAARRGRGEAVAVCFARTVRKRPEPLAHGPADT